MATLRFDVEADYSKVIKLREEITRLEGELRKCGSNNATPEMIGRLEGRLSSAKKEMGDYVTKAARVETENKMLGGTFDKLGGAIAGAFAIEKIYGFVSKVAEIRGEFQKLDLTFTTMLGSKEKSDALIKELMNTAAITPFSSADVTNGAKQLLAFGIEAEKINDTLVRLGDIAAGTGAQVGQLTNVFGQIKAAGRMNGGDLLQFINAGVPIIKALSDAMGVAESQVKELISQGKVGFPEVEKAIKSLTDQGSMFGGMMEQQSTTITGRISTLKDNFELMLNEVGKSTEGVFGTAIDLASSMVESYEKVGKEVVGLIATYGTYKAAVMLVATANSFATASETAHYLALLAQEKATKLAALAQELLNKTMLSNPYVLAATVLVSVTTALWAFYDSATEGEKAQQKLNDAFAEAEGKATDEQHQLARLKAELDNTTKGTDEYEQVKQKIIDQFGQYDSTLAAEIERVGLTTDAYRKLTDAIRQTALARGYEAATKDIHEDNQSKYADITKAAQDAMDDGTDKGAALYESFRSALASGQVSLGTNRLGGVYIEGLSKDVNDFLKKHTKVREDIIKGLDGINQNNKAIRKAEKQFLGDETQEDKAEEATINRELRNKKYWEEKRKELVAQKESYGSGQKKEIDAVNKEIAKVDKKLAAYADPKKPSGRNPNKTNADKEKREAKRKAKEQADASKKANEMLLKIEQENVDAVIEQKEDGYEKQRAETQNEYNKRIDDIEKYEKELKELNQKSGVDVMDNGLTKEQTNALLAARANATTQYIKQKNELFAEEKKANTDAMREFLAQYGTYEEQRLAITQQYEQKIAEAKTEGQKKTLQKQLEESLQSLDLEQLKKNINWEEVFGDLGKVSTQSLKRLKTQLQDFIKTNKKLDPKNIKELVEAINKIDDETKGRSPFATLGEELSKLKEATDAVKAAQDAYNEALKQGTAEEQANAAATLSAAQDAKRKQQGETTKAIQNASKQANEYLDVANDVLNLLNTLGVKTPQWLADTLSGFGDVVAGFEKIDLTKPMTIITGAIKIISGVAKSFVSLGGLINWTSSNANEVKKTIEKLTKENERLGKTISGLTDTLKNTNGGANALNAYNNAYKVQEQINKNLLNIAKAQAGYHNSHHSWNSYWGGFTGGEMSWMRKNIDANFNGDLFSLTPEQMKKLRDENGELWQRIIGTGKGGYGEKVGEALENYIDQAGKLVELTDDLKQKLTQTTFDSLRNSFVSSLADMSKNANDFSNDFSEMLFKAVLNSKIADALDDEIERFYKDWAEMSKDGLDATEAEVLRNRWDAITEKGLSIRNEASQITGHSGSSASQSASRGEYTAMSEDTGNEIRGRLTAIQEMQIRAEAQRASNIESLVTMQGSISQLAMGVTGIANIADDARNILASSYLELQEINDNTGRTAKYLKEMHSDLNEIKRKV